MSYGASASCVCYLLADEARAALHLVGTRAHLIDLLCTHAKHEHTDRHLATHVATVYRKEEGYVLINAHPAFIDPIGITGMVNEPPANVSSTMKMVQAYARLLPDGDPLLAELGRLRSPRVLSLRGAQTSSPEGSSMAANGDVSERMVFYATTRRHYPSELELTVDYGKSYVRDYPSGQHKAAVKAPQAQRMRLEPISSSARDGRKSQGGSTRKSNRSVGQLSVSDLVARFWSAAMTRKLCKLRRMRLSPRLRCKEDGSRPSS